MAKVILTVDDSASVRQMVKFTLAGAGYQVVEAVAVLLVETLLTRHLMTECGRYEFSIEPRILYLGGLQSPVSQVSYASEMASQLYSLRARSWARSRRSSARALSSRTVWSLAASSVGPW